MLFCQNACDPSRLFARLSPAWSVAESTRTRDGWVPAVTFPVTTAGSRLQPLIRVMLPLPERSAMENINNCYNSAGEG